MRSYWTRSRIAAATLLGAIVAFALLGPALIGIDSATQHLGTVLAPPGSAAWLGTDAYGRDMAARLATALRLSLALALLAVVSAALPGTLLGIAAGWRGGWIERLLVTVADAVLAIPPLLLLVLFVALSPDSFWPLYLGLSLSLWVEYFRVVRLATRTVMTSAPVEASRLLGFGRGYILRRHVTPVLVAPILTLATYGAATAVLALASLGFIGVGIHPPTAELGLMMTELLPFWQEAPWLLATPVVALLLTILSLAVLTGERAR